MFVLNFLARLFGHNVPQATRQTAPQTVTAKVDLIAKTVRNEQGVFVISAKRFAYSSVDKLWIAPVVMRELVAGTRTKVVYQLLADKEPAAGQTLYFNPEEAQPSVSDLKLKFQDWPITSKALRSPRAITVEVM